MREKAEQSYRGANGQMPTETHARRAYAPGTSGQGEEVVDGEASIGVV